MPGHLSPRQRVQLAKELLRRANGQPKLKARFRQTLRRHASNLMQVNLIEARTIQYAAAQAVLCEALG
jgi:hypothetical protein